MSVRVRSTCQVLSFFGEGREEELVTEAATQAQRARGHEEHFHFTREMMRGPIYRKYEKAIKSVWNPRELDYSQDAADWVELSEERQRALLGITVRFFAGEQRVTDELVPMLAAAHALNRYDWVMFLST